MSGAWGKGVNRAVAAAPPPGGMNNGGGGGGGRNGNRGGGGNNRRGPQNRGNNRRGSQQGGGNNNDNNNRGGGGGGGGRGRGGGGGGRNNSYNRRGSQQGGRNNNGQKNERINIRDIKLVQKGDGKTPEQRAVKRIDAKQFVAARLKYIEPCVEFSPHPSCHWTDETRLAQIQALCSKVMELGDVSKNKSKETAPPLEECKPLQVNEGTRWKSRAMLQHNPGVVQQEGPIQTTEEVVAKARLILNKISWTTLEKLTVKFMEQTQLAEKEDIRKAVIDMLVHKAQTEQHFGPMYAQLCSTIGKQVKQFKKDLLTQCQKEFEVDTAHKIEKANEGVTEPDVMEYNATLIRKAYVGHMKFLGELYLRDVVKLAIMMYCLDELLKDDEHEESLECFAHLMTTMGEKLDTHSKQNKKPFDWQKVVELRNSTKISNRIKFLLQDLLELKDRGWVKRRKEETAKTLDQIHKEVAEEEEKAAKASKMANRRANSQQNLRRSSSMASAPALMDEDGFVQIQRGSMKKVGSKLDMMSENGAGPRPATLRRSQSQPASMSAYTVGGSPSPYTKKTLNGRNGMPSAPTMAAPMEEGPAESAALSPEECAKKAKSLFKEYFVGGDTDDAVLSVHEVIQAGKDGSVDRGAKVIESATLMVMEMKSADVDKLLTVMSRVITEKKIESQSILQGLKDPLEFLSDIEIDAPLAGSHLAKIVAQYLKLGAIPTLDVLKEAPEYFLSDGKPAAFAVKVLKAREGEPSDAELELVASLMTEDDKGKFDSAKAMFAA